MNVLTRLAATNKVLRPFWTCSQSTAAISSSRMASPDNQHTQPHAQCYSSLVSPEEIPKKYLKYPTPDNCQVLRLPDGRHMSFGEYGSKAADAHPFIFMHGIPDTRLDACLLPSDQALAEKLNIRWIGIDRPGMGLSTFQPDRTILGWVDDLQCLINHLKLDKYRIFSASGGSPYALAAAKVLPRQNLRSVGIGFGTAPLEAGAKGLSVLNRIGFWSWVHCPWAFQWIFDRYIVPDVQESHEKTEAIVRKQIKYLPQKDREALEGEEDIQGWIRLFREIYRQGSARGYVEDSKLTTKHWGFELEDVGYPGIRLWYGKEDVNTPPELGRYMAARLSGAVLKEYEGKSHFTMWDHIEEILTDMMKDV